jgi:hypothetical protein
VCVCVRACVRERVGGQAGEGKEKEWESAGRERWEGGREKACEEELAVCVELAVCALMYFFSRPPSRKSL